MFLNNVDNLNVFMISNTGYIFAAVVSSCYIFTAELTGWILITTEVENLLDVFDSLMYYPVKTFSYIGSDLQVTEVREVYKPIKLSPSEVNYRLIKHVYVRKSGSGYFLW
jgi:hypothetical protein